MLVADSPFGSPLKRKFFDCRSFNHLRELIPNKEKLDKAAFLMSTMDYIKQLQVGGRETP